MGKEMLPESPQDILIKARDSLEACRNDIVFGTALAVWGESLEVISLGLLLLRRATKTEEQVTEDLIAPAKVELGRPVTDKQVEKAVRKSARKFARLLGLPSGFSKGTVDWHIARTKQIQISLGVSDKPLSQETTIFNQPYLNPRS